MRKFGILFILLISVVSCDDHHFQPIEMCSLVCSKDPLIGCKYYEVKCAMYDLNIQKYTSEWRDGSLEDLQYGSLIPQKEFLTKLRPDLYELGLIKKDQQKSLDLNGDPDFRKIRRTYEFH